MQPRFSAARSSTIGLSVLVGLVLALMFVGQASAVGVPTVGTVTPNLGPVAGGTTVTLTGTGFTGTVSVSVGGNNATFTPPGTDTSLTITTPPHAAGTVDILVTNASGQSLVAVSDQFTYLAVPTTSNLNPSTGPSSGGTSVTVTGTGLLHATSVTFGGSAGTSVNPLGDTSLTVTAPAHAAGAVSVVVNTPGGSSAGITYTYTAAVPAVSSVSPTTGSLAGGTLVTVNGSGFTGATLVTFGGVGGSSPNVLNDNSLQIFSPAHSAGTVDVLVTGPGGTSPVTVNDHFTYGSVTVPSVTGVSPATGSTSGGTLVTVTGTGFTGATLVTFGGAAGTGLSVSNDGLLQVLSPLHIAATVDIVVTTPGGSSPAVLADHFTYGSGAFPTVTGVSPTSGTTAGGTFVTVSGSGFTGAIQVTFGGVAGTSLSVTNDGLLTIVSPAHAAGAVDIVVTTGTGSSATSAVDLFTFGTVTGAPSITSLSPTSGSTAGGNTVTITGTAFTGTTSVSFGGTAASFTVNSDTSITATSPAHTAGLVDVIITNGVGASSVTTADQFTYGSGPVVTSISPTSGTSGTTVTITGSGFTGATSVTFGGTAATPSSTTDTQIIVNAPSHSSGVVDVIVVTPSGNSPTSTADQFTYGSTTTQYSLTFRWSLLVWNGHDGMSVSAAIKGQESPDNTATNDVSAQITAIFRWNASGQKWDAYFPGSESVPGANDFSTFSKGTAYWIAIAGPNTITWTIEQG